MKIKLINSPNILKESKNLVLPINSSNLKAATTLVKGLDEALKVNVFKAEKNSVFTFYSLGGFKKVILLGLDDDLSKYINNNSAMELGGELAKVLESNDKEVTINLTHIEDHSLVKQLAIGLSTGLRLKAYRFIKYFTNNKNKSQGLSSLSRIILVTENMNISEEIEYSNALVEGIYFTRDLITEPANKMYSDVFIERLKELTTLGLEVEVLNQKDLEDLKMGALLSVNQGSSHEAKVAIIKWNGGGNSKPLAFVGKGVTFDSGGLSLKPPSAMIDMKGDMAGAATVAGLFKVLAKRKAKVNAIGVVGLVENLINSNATKPGDIVTSYNGKTIEVLNTDAEGRLVLADILSYTKERFNPQFIINLATLTGAIIVALGYLRAGLFTNNESLAKELLLSGELSGDKLWQLPATDEYLPMMKSNIADIANIATIDRAAGSVTAAVFLKEFVGDSKWAHIDIAGVSWRPENTSLANKGASGFGIRLLDWLVANYYEVK